MENHLDYSHTFLNETLKPKVSVVIPAYNEAVTIGNVIANCKSFCDEVIVVDDGCTDDTAAIAKEGGALVVSNEENLGIPKSIQRGIDAAQGYIIVTMDADGQHDPSLIPKLVKPLAEGRGEVILGVRDEIPHLSERIINALTSLSVKCSDAGTGFRAIKADMAKKMKLSGKCLCGTFILEANKLGARIVEIHIQTKPRIDGKRRIRTRHLRQIFYVLREMIFSHK